MQHVVYQLAPQNFKLHYILLPLDYRGKEYSTGFTGTNTVVCLWGEHLHERDLGIRFLTVGLLLFFNFVPVEYTVH